MGDKTFLFLMQGGDYYKYQSNGDLCGDRAQRRAFGVAASLLSLSEWCLPYGRLLYLCFSLHKIVKQLKLF